MKQIIHNKPRLILSIYNELSEDRREKYTKNKIKEILEKQAYNLIKEVKVLEREIPSFRLNLNKVVEGEVLEECVMLMDVWSGDAYDIEKEKALLKYHQELQNTVENISLDNVILDVCKRLL